MCAEFELYDDKKRSNIYPNPNQQEEDAKNICCVVEKALGQPFFNEQVSSAILEVLRIQTKGQGEAHTFLYFDTDWNKGKVEAIKNKYFTIIENIFGEKPLSILDNFYFEDMIWIGSSETGGQSSGGSGEKDWQNAEKKLLKDYDARGVGENVDDVETYKEDFKCYGSKLKQVLFSECPYFYILTIPVALSNKSKVYQEKIGAVFLHIGATKKIEVDQLLNVYQKVILYWHYNWTGEVLEQRQREREEAGDRERQAQERAMLYDHIQGPIDELTALLQEAHKPLSDLTSVMSPMKQFIFAGKTLAPFFLDGETITLEEVGYTDPSLATLEVQTHHTYKDDKQLYFKNLIPAILLIALGESSNARDPLWDYLRFYLSVPPEPKQDLANAIKKRLPKLTHTWDSIVDDDKADIFGKIKSWFNDSYKPGGTLSPNLLQLTADTLKININESEFKNIETEQIGVVSSLPIDTIGALVALHQEYEVKKLEIKTDTDVNKVILTLTGRNHYMDKDDAKRLLKSVYSGLEVGHWRGSTTSILCQIFGSEKIKRKERNILKQNLELVCKANKKIFKFKYKSQEKAFTFKFFNDNQIAITTSFAE